jgi:hypothetical protein
MQSSHVTEEQIRRQAYAIYLHRGGQHGHDRDDWLQAEYELMQLPVRQIAARPLSPPGRGRIGNRSLVALVRMAMISGVV